MINLFKTWWKNCLGLSCPKIETSEILEFRWMTTLSRRATSTTPQHKKLVLAHRSSAFASPTTQYCKTFYNDLCLVFSVWVFESFKILDGAFDLSGVPLRHPFSLNSLGYNSGSSALQSFHLFADTWKIGVIYRHKKTPMKWRFDLWRLLKLSFRFKTFSNYY